MKIVPTAINGVVTVETEPLADARGVFARLFCGRELEAVTGARHIVQANYSQTMKTGAVRGMHFQYPPHAEMKLVRCISGRVLDVAIDLRHGSETFLSYHASELSADNRRMLVVPEGCAHGFQVLEEGSEMLYLHTEYYEKTAEGAVRFDDPAIGIKWPLSVTDVSGRDERHPFINDDFKGITL